MVHSVALIARLGKASNDIHCDLNTSACHCTAARATINRDVQSSNACRQEASKMSDSPAGVLDGKLFADVPEVAALLRIDQRTVRRSIEHGDIPAIRTGQRWRIPTSWLRAQAQIGDNDAVAT
jgi:excisionase family DNA binding protein